MAYTTSSSQEINRLRKEGKIEEAYLLGKEVLKTDFDNIWNRRAVAWALYSKICDTALSFENKLVLLEELKQLQLDENENMLYDNIAWQIRLIVINIANNDKASLSKVFNCIKPFTFHPSNGYSALFKEFNERRENWQQYIEFCDWWNFNKFMPQDYSPYEYVDYKGAKKSIMSVAEQSCCGYCNALLSQGNKEKIKEFLPRVEQLANSHPEYQYPPYYISKLYMAIGDKQSAFNAILPFVKKKPNDYWVWQCLGDASDDDAVKFACYSRALTCSCRPAYLVKVKEHYAQMLVNCHYYNEAKTEIEQIIKIRTENKWNISAQLRQTATAEWYKTAKANKSNADFYATNAQDAEMLVYPDMCSFDVFVTEVIKSRQLVNYVDIDGKRGTFNFRSYNNIRFKVGEILTLKIRDNISDTFVKPISCSKSNDLQKWQPNMLNFSGTLKLIEGKNFGVVKCSDTNIFLPPQLAKGKLNGQTIEGCAIKSFDAKQNRMGWTAFQIK